VSLGKGRKEGREVRMKVSKVFKSVHVILMRRHIQPSLCWGWMRLGAMVRRSRPSAPCCGVPPSLAVGCSARCWP
jgi:hypothetical protein